MPTILAISGSLRAKSFNTMLLRAAVAAAPAGATLEVASIAGIPLYDGDQEAELGIPAPVTTLKDRIAAADGLLLVTPEYNAGIPGVFKNAIDWLSRPAADIARVFGDLPVGLMGATPGRGGTTLSQDAWQPVLRKLTMLQYPAPGVGVASAGKVFDDQGALIDETVRGLVQRYLAGFAAFIARHGRAT